MELPKTDELIQGVPSSTKPQFPPETGGNPFGGNPNLGLQHDPKIPQTNILTTPSSTLPHRPTPRTTSPSLPPKPSGTAPPISTATTSAAPPPVQALHPSASLKRSLPVSALLQSENDQHNSGSGSGSGLASLKIEAASLPSTHLSMSLSGMAGTPSRPPSRAPGTRSRIHTPRSLTPAAGMSAERPSSSAGGSRAGGGGGASVSGDRPLNVADALGYLDAVKIQFQEQPDVYNHFLDIMKDFKSQVIDTPGVIERVSTLFQGNAFLIQGFNTFLPPGYRIEVSSDPRNENRIMVVTPAGTMTSNALGTNLRLNRDLSSSAVHTPVPQFPPFGGQAPPPILPVGLGPGSRPASPMGHHAPQYLHPSERSLHPNLFSLDVPHPYSPATQGAQAAATVLGGMGGPVGPGGRTTEQSAKEFNHAIQFLNKIKNRYPEGAVYREFLEILQTYQKEQKQLHDSQVFAQVSRLFKDAPELMEEFKDFLPEMLGPSAQREGLVGIMPHPTQSSGWDHPEPAPVEKAKPSRRRKRAADKEPVSSQSQAATKTANSRAAKKAKLSHNKPDAAPSPQFSPYQIPPSPEPAHHRHLPQQQHPSHVHGVHMHTQDVMPPINNGQIYANSAGISSHDELMFFDRTKKALEATGTYEDFLKLLNLFAKDVIDTKTLVKRAEAFLTEGDLLLQFKELLDWDDKRGNIEYGPPGSIRTSAPDPNAASCPDDDEGPSYRKLPLHETRLACSGRDQLAWSVLNDTWVSHPTWASEDAGFLTHKKNTFEEALHKCEEERHEYQVHIDAITRTIATLDPLESRIEDMTAEERVQFKLGPDLGGQSPAIYQKIIKKVYGREAAQEVYRALQEYPSVAVPVVLARLKQKNEEWRRLQREWNRTWREIEAKNFYKALDMQVLTKNVDRRNITVKALVQDIEAAKAAQIAELQKPGAKPFTSLGYQIELQFNDMDVLQDTLKLVYSFLDHSSSHYSLSERRGIEQFLRSLIPTLYSFSPHEFGEVNSTLRPAIDDDDEELDETDDRPEEETKPVRSGRRSVAGSTQSTGVPAGDLRKRLLKTVQEGQTTSRAAASAAKQQSNSNSAGTASPVEKPSPATNANKSTANDEPDEDAGCAKDRSKSEESWIGGIPLGPQGQGSTLGGAGETPVAKRPFFAGTTFYALLRLIQMLYSRVLLYKQIGAESAKEKHASLLANPVAVELGLDEPNGPAVVLAQAIEAVGDSAGGREPNVLYLYFLDACEKMFANDMDQATFEEHLRWFFRTKIHYMYNLDKMIIAIIKQVQQIQGDNRCQELWHLLQETRKQDNVTLDEIISYRREAERHVGADDHLYKIDCDRDSKAFRIQLIDADDPSADEENTPEGRWREYCATYVSHHPTEWLPSRLAEKQRRPYLKRTLIDESPNSTSVTEGRLSVAVSLGTYKLFYAADSEDVFIRRTSSEREGVLRARALAREEERRRTKWLK